MIDAQRAELWQPMRATPYARFRVTLLAIGLAPLVVIPLLLARFPLPDHGAWNTSFIYFTGVLHVGMTAFFYIDPEMGPYRQQHRAVFVGWPIGIGLATGIALGVLPSSGQAFVAIAFAIWLAHHYTGQQVGVVNLLLKSDVRTTRLAPRERRFIRCTEVLIVLGLVRTAGIESTPLKNIDFDLWLDLAFAVLLIGLVALLAISARNGSAPDEAAWPLRAISLMWATAFVAPFALFANPFIAAATVAAMHGLPYIFLVAYLSRSRGHGRFAWAATLMAGATVAAVYMLILNHAPAGLLAKAAPAVLFTLVAAHRVVDARVWRLREAPQLAYMQKSFEFL